MSLIFRSSEHFQLAYSKSGEERDEESLLSTDKKSVYLGQKPEGQLDKLKRELEVRKGNSLQISTK